MEASEIASRPAQRRTLGPWFVYLTITAVILFLYVRGWLFLRAYAGNIVAGLVQVSIPRQKLYLPIIVSLVLMIAAWVIRSQVAKFVNRIPLGLRGLLLPLPFYFTFTLNWSMTGLVLIVGVLAWVFYESLARFLRLVLSPLPTALQVPLMRYWPAVLYTYLLTNLILPTVVVAIGLMAFHLFDASMENYFAPVWDFHRTLTPMAGRAISLTRLALGATAPFVFSYSWGLFNPLMDRYTALFAVLIFLINYFIMRGPRTAVRILIFGILLGIGITDFAWADNCSGADDCYNTVGFNSAALVALFGGLAGVGLNLFLDFTPVVGEVKSLIEFLIGRPISFRTDEGFVTGEKLSWWERMLALLGAIPLIGELAKLGKAAKAADKVVDAGRLLNEASDLARLENELSDAARAEGKVSDLVRSQGIPAGNARGIQRIADKFDVNIAVRRTNPDSLDLIRRGYPPKPMDIKSKTINELDTLIGASRENIGKVGYFEPKAMSLDEFSRLPPEAQARWVERFNERIELQQHMDALVGGKLIKIDNGVVINTGLNSNMDTWGKAFVGDHDIFSITDRAGNDITDAMKNLITKELKEYGVEHGAHMDWYRRSDFNQDMWEAIINKHTASELGGGGEALIMFGEGDPILIYYNPLFGG